MKRLLFILPLLLLPSSAHAAAFFADLTAGACSATGTTVGTPMCSEDRFVNGARTAGDVLFVKRGTATTTGTFANFAPATAGTQQRPIVVSADDDNIFGNFATTTETFTVTPGSYTLTANAAGVNGITDLATSTWIYVQGDCSENPNAVAPNECNFYDMVSGISSTTVSLYIPYSGNQSGSGLVLRNMGADPVRGVIGTNSSLPMSSIPFWVFQGLAFRSSTGIAQFGSTYSETFKDMDILIGTAAQAGCFQNPSNNIVIGIFIQKVICLNFSTTGYFWSHNGGSSPQGAEVNINVKDSYFAATTSTNGGLTNINTGLTGLYQKFNFENVVVSLGSGSQLYNFGDGANNYTDITTKNVKTNLSGTQNRVRIAQTSYRYGSVLDEDYEGAIGDNRFWQYQLGGSAAGATSTMQTSTTTQLRAGGGPVSTKVTPGENLSTTSPSQFVQLFNYPIYTNPVSHTYSVFFSSTSTAAWTSNPLASELYIDCSYLSFTTPTTTRAVKASTGTVNFTGSTAWQSLSVTCLPTNSGLLYLRGWYEKAREPSKLDEFYFDNTPVIQ